MSGVRALQKEKTRRALINAAFNQLGPEKSFSNLSLREVAREAGIAPTSFYRHFKDMDELGLTMVDEVGILLRQLMRKARKRIEHDGGSVIYVSLETFFEFVDNHANMLRLLLRERAGTSLEFRAAALREIQHFTSELSTYIAMRNAELGHIAYLQAEAMVTLVFESGAQALDMNQYDRARLKERLRLQLRMIGKGAMVIHAESQIKNNDN